MVIDIDFDSRKFQNMLFALGDNIRETVKKIGISEYAFSRNIELLYMPSVVNIIKICRYGQYAIDDLLQIPEDCRNRPEYVCESIGGRIAWLLERDRLTKAEAMRILNVNDTSGHINRWIKNYAMPSFWSIRHLCKLFKVSADWLIEGVENV